MTSHIETVSKPNCLKRLWTSARRFVGRFQPDPEGVPIPEDGVARYSVALPEIEATLGPESVFSFSLADADEPPTPDTPQAETPRASLDLTLELRDRAGNTARLPLSHFSLLQPQIQGRIGKANFMHTLSVSEAVFQTFAFRLGDFTVDNPAFDPATLAEITFIFDRTSADVVILDEIGLNP